MEWLKDIFLFDADQPLIFTKFYFWGFFAVVLGVYSVIHPHRALRNAFLFFVSLFFYYKTGGPFFVLLLFSTVADYLIGFAIHGSRKRAVQTAWLVLSIVVNLLLLSYFKYGEFYVDTVNALFDTNIHYYNHFTALANAWTNGNLPIDELVPPVGISFFTFQTISYAVDVYQKKIQPVRSILDFGFYVSFFPQLVAGPIVRASDFIPQIYEPYRLSEREFGLAVYWVLKGLIKKLVIADYLGVNLVDRVFGHPELYTGAEGFMSLFGYSLQVYGDFSGYTDIAIGISLLMGFRLPRNFNSPYKARSVGEFWKRWHISLSTWLKDYLYIPLGGSRKASFLTYVFFLTIPIFLVWFLGAVYLPAVLFGSVLLIFIMMYLDWRFKTFRKELTTSSNLMITMLLGGFWHGSTWLFVIWGGLNGFGLVIFKLWKKIGQRKAAGEDEIAVEKAGRRFNFFGRENITRHLTGTALGLGALYLHRWMMENPLDPVTHTSLELTSFWGIALLIQGIGLLSLLWGVLQSLLWVVRFLLPAGPVKDWFRDPLMPVRTVANTFAFITFTRIWFRAPDLEIANRIMMQMWHNFGFEVLPDLFMAYAKVLYVLYIGLVLHWAPEPTKELIRDTFIALPHWTKALVVILVVFLTYQAISSDMQAFIYFQF